jgi:4-amino-4-deoxy-L-arabinose transferase-like glycosyltransferase
VKSLKPIWVSVINHGVFTLLGAEGAVLIVLSTSHFGAGLDPDSVTYIGTARNLANGLGAVSYGGNPLVLQPPFYPFLLAIIARLFGVDPLSSTRVVNALIFGLTIYFSGWLISNLLGQSRIYSLVGAACILASPALFGVSVMAYSEPLFDLLAVLSLLCLTVWLRDKNGIWFGLLILSAALACMTRYVGITLILAGGVTLLLLEHESLKVRIVHAIVFGLLSLLPVAIWLIRNYDVTGAFLGPRAPAAYGLIQILKVTLNTLAAWYLPGVILASRTILFLFALGIGFLAGFRLRGDSATVRALRPEIAKAAPLLLFAVTYLAFMVISSVTTEVSPLKDRLLSPIYVPVTLLVLMLADQLLAPIGQKLSPRFPGTFAVVLVAVWLLYPLRAIRADLQTGVDQGWGYSGQVWRESPLVRYLQHEPLPASQALYSNGPDVLYILLNLQAKLSPVKTTDTSGEIPASSPIAKDLSQVSEIWPGSSSSYLIWFDKITNRHYLYSLNDLQRVANLQQIDRFDDGAIYLVSRKP